MDTDKTVYLAGPIRGLSYKESMNWREKAIEELAKYNIRGISPMRMREELANETSLKEHYEHAAHSSKRIITRDRMDVFGCKVVLANLLDTKEISIGTMVEYGWADAARKPVVTVIEKEGNPHDHGFIREISGYRVETLEEGLLIARKLLYY